MITARRSQPTILGDIRPWRAASVAVDHAALTAKDGERLKGSRQLWLHGEENLPRRWAKQFLVGNG